MNIQFYLPSSKIKDEIIVFDEQESKHISQVLRLSVGDQIQLTDGEGGKYSAIITQLVKGQVQAKVLTHEFQSKPLASISIALASLHKRDRLEWAIEKSVELGVDIFYLFEAERSEYPRWKQERLSHIMISAAKQSKRCWYPRLVIKNSALEIVEDYAQRMQEQTYSMFVAHEGAQTDWNSLEIKPEESRLYFVGPEGGFSELEIEEFANASARSFIMGSANDAQILRSETAVVSLLAKHY